MRPWNDESGDWQSLGSSTQAPRYRAIARIIERFCPEGTVLDVGCGEAVLLDYLPKEVTYLGLEPSATAAELARSKHARSADIRHITGEGFDAGESRWDCVVFNEVLYYSSAPVDLLDKYANLVNPEGVVVVSIYQKRDKGIRHRLMRWLGRRQPTSNIDCTKIAHKYMAQDGWLIEVDESVARPGSAEYWRICAAKPRRQVR